MPMTFDPSGTGHLRMPDLKNRPAGGAGSGIYYLAEGDSLTYGIPNGPSVAYPAKYSPSGSGVVVNNQSVPGSTLFAMAGSTSNLTDRAGADDSFIGANPGYARYVMSVLIGVNDIVTDGGSLSAFLTALAPYFDARRAAGWRVVAITNTPCASSATWNNTSRLTIQNTLASWMGIHIDALVDVISDSVMGVTGAQANSTYYADGLHYTPAGHIEMARIVKPVLDAVCFDTTAPTITSSNAASGTDGSPFSMALTANEPVGWSIVGGANAGLFTISNDALNGSTLSLITAQVAGSYAVTIRATDRARLTTDQNVTLTVAASSVPDKTVLDRTGAYILARDGSYVITR